MKRHTKKTLTHYLAFSAAAFLSSGLLSPQSSFASGLDVQLKDLRNSFFYLSTSKKTDSAKNCKKLNAKEIRSLGRLIHCDPEDDHVVCPLKSGEKLYAFEIEASCEKHFTSR